MKRDQQVVKYQTLLKGSWDEESLVQTQGLLHSFPAVRDTVRRPVNVGVLRSVVGIDETSPDLVRDLVIGLVAATEEDDALLRDTVSLLALQSVDVLKETQSVPLEKAILLVAAFLFEEAHARRHGLEAEVHEARGRADEARASWKAALATTDPDAHDYLTRVQTLWFAYLDAGMEDAAEDLVATLTAELRAQFHAEVEGGLAHVPTGGASDLVRVHAGLPFGDNQRPQVPPSRNALGPNASSPEAPCTT